jgi:hypothetical protein
MQLYALRRPNASFHAPRRNSPTTHAAWAAPWSSFLPHHRARCFTLFPPMHQPVASPRHQRLPVLATRQCGMRRLGTRKSALGTSRSAFGPQRSALGISALGTRLLGVSALGTWLLGVTALGTWQSALGTQLLGVSALGTWHSAPGPRHLASRHSALGSQPSALGTRHSALSFSASRHLALGTWDSALCTSALGIRPTAPHRQLGCAPRPRSPAHSHRPHKSRRDWSTLAILRRLHRPAVPPSHRRFQRRCVRSTRSPQPQHPPARTQQPQHRSPHFALALHASRRQ